MKKTIVYVLVVLLILSSLFLFSCAGEEAAENASPSPSPLEKIEIEPNNDLPVPVPPGDGEDGEELLPMVIPENG